MRSSAHVIAWDGRALTSRTQPPSTHQHRHHHYHHPPCNSQHTYTAHCHNICASHLISGDDLSTSGSPPVASTASRPALRYIDSVHLPCESHKAFDAHAPSDSALAQALV
ncbi:hypothetical protein SVAN01_09029 [Stagonosporopsis vannaccii]|nr:hypothetical protein SVAN01_09029 [Stagonosporopsis vannaccii]